MCVIIYKPYGKTISDKVLATCYENNPDGAGIAYQNSQIDLTYFKGFMSYAKFKKFHDKINSMYDIRKLEIVYHFRIGTSGTLSPALCHPFPIDIEFFEQEKVFGIGVPLLFHNGVIGQGDMYGHSDTQLLVRKLAYLDSIERDKYLLNTKAQRFVYMRPHEEPLFYGTWLEEYGCLFSNMSYKNWEY